MPWFDLYLVKLALLFSGCWLLARGLFMVAFDVLLPMFLLVHVNERLVTATAYFYPFLVDDSMFDIRAVLQDAPVNAGVLEKYLVDCFVDTLHEYGMNYQLLHDECDNDLHYDSSNEVDLHVNEFPQGMTCVLRFPAAAANAWRSRVALSRCGPDQGPENMAYVMNDRLLHD